jgi:SAM-dependent methyltransferase
MNHLEEKQFIESLTARYITSDISSYTCLMRQMLVRTFKPYINNGGRALELGSEIGYMSERIAALVDQIDIVDASDDFLEHVKKRGISNACYYCKLFEEFKPPCQYDYVFASHILEHLVDVPMVLQMVVKALKKTGYFFVAVPNAHALSRQLARHMGLLNSLYELTPTDLQGGHRRVYDITLLTRELTENGFEIVSQGGVLFKSLADFQMDKLIDLGILGPEQFEGLYKLGNEYPSMCSDLYAVAQIK